MRSYRGAPKGAINPIMIKPINEYMSLRTGTALLTSVVAWAALALQLVLIVERMTTDGATISAAIWRLLGFFTILTNLAVAAVATAMARWPNSSLAGPRVQLATAAAITLVGIVYSLALRAIWKPTGWQAVADHALHDATPILFLASWALARHGHLTLRDALWAAVGPLIYCFYAMARGALDGWYAYWFLDPTALAAGQILKNLLMLVVLLVAIAVLLVAVDRWLGRCAFKSATDGGRPG